MTFTITPHTAFEIVGVASNSFFLMGTVVLSFRKKRRVPYFVAAVGLVCGLIAMIGA